MKRVSELSALVGDVVDGAHGGRSGRPQHRGGDNGRARRLRSDQGLLTVCRGGAVQITVLDQGLSWTARTEGRGGARRARVEIPNADRANAQELGRAVPDLGEGFV